ncbi:MAG: hypothetical protein WBB29_06000 [Geitlerinemataceae cyanobacterium]
MNLLTPSPIDPMADSAKASKLKKSVIGNIVGLIDFVAFRFFGCRSDARDVRDNTLQAHENNESCRCLLLRH